MTLEELQEAAIAEAFPAGAPDNLLGTINSYVVAALIDIQDFIPCFAYRHDDLIHGCNLYWHCGTSQVALPRGKVLRVYTVQNRGDGFEWCSPVIYSPTTLRELRRWQSRYKTCWRSGFFTTERTVTSNPPLPLGFDLPNISSDSVSGRAMSGLYAIDPTAKRLILAPWLQSYEAVVIEWQGIKRSWAPTDLVPDDRDFIRLVAWWVAAEHGRKWATQDLHVRIATYNEVRRDMMVRCRDETRIHGEPVTAEEVDVGFMAYWTGPVDLETIQAAQVPDLQAKVTLVGDLGTAASAAADVAEAVAASNPPPEGAADESGNGWHFTLGDNVYSPATVEQALAPYSDYSVVDRLRLTLGESDLDEGDLGQSQFGLVPQPVNSHGNSRWYSQRVGPIEFFVLNSGFDSADTVVEPDGNWEGSYQHVQVQAAVIRSTATWKVVLIHDAFDHAALAWVSDLPAHAIISAHRHYYERAIYRNRLHLIVGTGGADLDVLGTPLAEDSVQVREHGFLQITASCLEICFEFKDSIGVVHDRTCSTETTPVIPPVRSWTLYFGRSTKSSGFNESDVLAWDSVEKMTRAGDYSFAEDEVTDTYCCFAIPVALGLPMDTGLGQGFRIGLLALAMGRPDGTPPFGTMQNGYGVELVTVDGVPCRVYRTYNVLHGAVVLTIT